MRESREKRSTASITLSSTHSEKREKRQTDMTVHISVFLVEVPGGATERTLVWGSIYIVQMVSPSPKRGEEKKEAMKVKKIPKWLPRVILRGLRKED